MDARPDDLELADIVDGDGGLTEPQPHGLGKTLPGCRAEYPLQPLTRRMHCVAGAHDLCTAHGGSSLG